MSHSRKWQAELSQGIGNVLWLKPLPRSCGNSVAGLVVVGYLEGSQHSEIGPFEEQTSMAVGKNDIDIYEG